MSPTTDAEVEAAAFDGSAAWLAVVSCFGAGADALAPAAAMAAQVDMVSGSVLVDISEAGFVPSRVPLMQTAGLAFVDDGW